MKKILGIDCGGVIFPAHGRAVPGSLENIKKIVESKRFDKTYIISRAKILTQYYFLARLWYLDFWNYTGISRNDLYFCRYDEDKAALCKQLNVNYFVDDRFEVLCRLTMVDKRYALNPKPTSREQFAKSNPGVTIVQSWAELTPMLIDSSV